MKYIDIYNNIKNPLEDDEVFKKLILAFQKRMRGFGGFYSSLVHSSNAQQHSINQKDREEFSVNNFNKWKKALLSISPEQLEQLKRQHSYDDTVDKLIAYFKNVPDITTLKELEDIKNDIWNNQKDKGLESAFENFFWESLGAYSGWTHVASRYLEAKKTNHMNIQHRLYLNVNSADIYKFSNEFMKKCNDKHLEFYFKFDEYTDRDDTLVIYSNTENLPEYIEIVKEIAREHPDIKSRIAEPPILTGKIDGWIGYGSEPTPKNGQRRSFNEVRSECIEKAIESNLSTWYESHKNDTVDYSGKLISMQEYLALLKTADKLASMRRTIERTKNKYTPEQFEKQYKYNLSVIDDPEFVKQLLNAYRTMINKYLNGSSKNVPAIDIPTINGKSISIRLSSIHKVTDLLLPYALANDKNLKNNILRDINRESTKEGIDINNYAFDVSAKKLLEGYDSAMQIITNNYNYICQAALKRGFKVPKAKLPHQTIIEYDKYLKEYIAEIKQEIASRKQKTSQGQKPSQSTKKVPLSEKGWQPWKYTAKAMTDDEIRQSQEKLGFVKPTTSQSTKEVPLSEKGWQPWKYTAKAMTDEEIRQSQILLGIIPNNSNCQNIEKAKVYQKVNKAA